MFVQIHILHTSFENVYFLPYFDTHYKNEALFQTHFIQKEVAHSLQWMFEICKYILCINKLKKKMIEKINSYIGQQKIYNLQ